MERTILVAGGGGFIGFHLCKKLLSNKSKVVCIDNLSTGSQKNIDELSSDEKFRFIQKDVCDTDLLEKVEGQKFDEIYHLASPASVTYITDHPVEAALANSIGTKNLLQIALKNKAKLLFASSSEAYGDPKEHPQKESYRGNVNSVGVRSGYDEGKRFGEALCMAYHRELGANSRIVRIFNTYGPNSRKDDSRVIPAFVNAALENKPISVHGNGTQTRSFCYVSDMVEGFIKVMEGGLAEPINLGNPKEYKIIDVANMIVSFIGSSSKIEFAQRPPDDPTLRQPDITLAKEKCGWEPVIGLEEGLKKTVEYFKNN